MQTQVGMRRSGRLLRVAVLAMTLTILGMAGIGPVQAQSTKLSWRPPTLTNPTTINVVKSQVHYELSTSKDYILKMPSSAVKQLYITGGRNVVLIGGEIYIPWQGSSASIASRVGLKIKDSTGTVHIEGLWMHGSDLSEGIQIDAPRAIIQLQNIRIDSVRARDEVRFRDNHPDMIQPYGGYRELRVDGLTGATDYQGLFLSCGCSRGATTLRRVNILGLPTARHLFWVEPRSGVGTVTLDNVWVDVPSQRSGGLGQSVWPQSSGSLPNRATIAKDSSGRTYATWPAMKAPYINGRVTEGTPSTGDFVRQARVGIRYVTPGYK